MKRWRQRITRNEFYQLGAWRHRDLYRTQCGSSWAYYRVWDNR
jgi:hypothetical protein